MRAWLLAWGIIWGCASCASRPAALPPGPEPGPALAPPAPEPARFLPVEVAPSGDGDTALQVLTTEGLVRVDHAGARWLAGPSPRRADGPARPLLRLFWREGVGLIGVGLDREVLVARTPLGPFEAMSALPALTQPDEVAHYRGGLTATSADGVWRSTDLRSWKRLASFGDRVPQEALIGGDGAGLGLFYPQLLAATSDGGESWTRLDDRGLTALELSPSRDRVVVETPFVSGERPRAWQPGAPSLVAVDDLPPGDPLPSVRQRGAAPRPAEPRGPQRYPLATAVASGLASVVGDRFVGLVEEPRRRLGSKIWTAGEAAIGEGVSFPAEGWQIPCERAPLVAASPTGAAIACDETIRVRLAGGDTRLVAIAGAALSLAWQGERLLSAHLVRKEGEVVGDLAVFSTEFPPGSDPVVTPLTVGVPSLPPAVPRLIGPAEAGGAAWLLVSGRATVASSLAGGSFTPRGFALPARARVVGLDREGALLFVNAGKPSLYRLSIDGALAEHPLSFTPAGEGAPLLTVRGEHGLLFDERGGLHQTDDGGESFFGVEAPPGPLRGGDLVCGESRCQLGDALVRAGWGRGDDPTAPASPAQAPAATEPSGPAQEDAPGLSLAAIGCVPDPSLDPAVGPDITLEQLGRGAEGELFAAFGRTAAGVLVEVVGLRDGQVQTRPVGVPPRGSTVVQRSPCTDLAPPTRVPVAYVERRAGVFPWAIVASDFGSGIFAPVGSGFPMVWDRGPGKPFGRALLTGVGSTDFQLDAWYDGGGVLGRVDRAHRRLQTFSTSGAVALRGLTDEAVEQIAGGEHVTGSIAEPGDGAAYLLREASGPEARDLSSWPVTLYSVGGGRLREREFRAKIAASGDRGWAVVGHRGGPAIALLEPTDDGGEELRIRPLDRELRPGAALVVPGTRARPLGRMALSACGEGPLPRGEIDIVQGTGPRSAGASGASGLAFSAHVRFDESGACVESEVVRVEAELGGRMGVFAAGHRTGVSLDGGRLRGVRCAGG